MAVSGCTFRGKDVNIVERFGSVAAMLALCVKEGFEPMVSDCYEEASICETRSIFACSRN